MSTQDLDLPDILQETLVNAKGEKISTREYLKKHKIIVLALMVSWCGHCQRFSPILKEYLKKHPDVGVILIPSEDDRESFDKYFADHPWVRTDFEHGQVISRPMMALYGFQGFPSAVALSPDGELITTNVRDFVQKSKPIKKH